MKKIILAAFIALSIVSCSSDNDSQENISGIQTGNVILSFGDSFLNPGKATGKNSVNRPSDGSIPADILDISVTAVNSVPAILPTTTDFNLVASGGASQFIISNVSAGTNTFTATAQTNTASSINAEALDSVSAVAKFTLYKGQLPYAKYSSTVANKKINFDIAQDIHFDMTTPNGRLNTLIKTDKTITQGGLIVIVTRQRFTATGVAIDAPVDWDISGNNSLVSTWNDDDAIENNYTSLNIKIYEPSDVTHLNPIDTKPYELSIDDHTSTNTTINVSKDKITSSTNTSTFTFPTWITIDNNN